MEEIRAFWFPLPIDTEQVEKILGIGVDTDYYYMTGKELPFADEVQDDTNVEKLNAMYEMICELPDYITDSLDKFVSHYGSLEEVYEHKDDVYFYPDCENMTHLAYYFIDEMQVLARYRHGYRTISTMKHTTGVYPLRKHLSKQAEEYTRYHIRSGRSETGSAATDSFYILD